MFQVINVVAAIDGRDSSATSDVTIEHAVHYHGVDASCSSGDIVIAYDASHISATCNVSITVAVNDTGRTIKLAHQTANFLSTADRSAQYAAVVNTSCSRRLIGYTTHIGSRADSDTFQHYVLHRSVVDGVEQSMGKTADLGVFTIGIGLTLKDSGEGCRNGAATGNICC